MVETRKTAVPSYKELSDSDSDPYEHKPSSSVRRKRQRTKKTRKTAAATDAKSTTAFWTVLPLDLVHEIFRCLEPIDLLQLARSNKGLRDHLMSKGASLAVWRASRQNVIGGTPPCPDDMSEPQFARLLFAIECFVCGRTPKLWSGHKCGYQVYWETRIRCCDMCSSASFMSNIKIARKFPDIENIETALELLSSHGTGPSWRRTRYYYTPAVYDVMAIIEDFENRTLARMPRVKEDFEEYKTVQKAKVAAILEAAEIYRTWSEKRRDTIHLLDVELQRRWKEVFTAKLLALGHDLVDIQESYWLFEMRRQWTEENWNVIRTRAVDVVTKKKADRLKSIRNNLIARRQKVATQVLKSHPSQANIEPNLFNPALDEIISNLGAMKRVVFRKDDMEVTPEDFEGALDGVEEWVEGWRIERRAKLLEIMVSAGASQIGEAPMELDFDRLRLATTMFFCSTPRRYAAGAQKALCLASVTQHTATRRCGKEGPDWSPACLSYSTDAEEMVRRLVIAVGLDPKTTTAADMDAEDARFYCKDCPKWDKLARSWRNCAAHFQEHPLSDFQGWIPLSAADTDRIIRQEISNRNDDCPRIRCLRHHQQDYQNAHSFRCHLENHHPGRVYRPEDVAIDPLVAPQPISLEGLTLKPRQVVDQSTSEPTGTPKALRRRRRKRLWS